MHRHAYAQQCTNTNHIHNKAGRIQTKCIKSSSGKYTHIYFVYLYHNYNTNTPLGITAHYYPPAATSGDDSQGLSSKERLKPGIRPASLPTQTTSTTPPTLQDHTAPHINPLSSPAAEHKGMWEDCGRCPKAEWRHTHDKIFC